METGKPELASVASHMSAVAAQTERRMEIQAPLTAVYIHTVPALPTQPALAVADPSALHLSMPPLYSKETLPFLTLHIAGGLQPGLSVTATPPAAKPKSAGKHLCPHCGRDCMKPSVLEKHLRCHTGERPYPCTVCGVSFKTQSNLYKHKRTQAHARLSSESEQSTVGSLDSLSRSTETASLFVDEPTDDSMGAERNASLQLLSPEKTKVATQTMDINDTNITSKTESLVTHFLADDKATKEHLPPSNRHVVLQRQEATLFSKQWDSAVSSKSKSHESTDSGFSESSEHYPSPGSLLPDHSMDSLTETSTEQGEDSNRQIENQEDKNATKEQENKSLEERISKLISQNSAVVEDKHLEHVRPRKTTLSKQGSIDLPLPYTYKDSFHFDMRISKLSNAQRNRRPVLYTSVPTQQSTSVEHTPLTRSNSLPFSVNLLQPDLSSPTTPSQRRDYSTLFRRGSSGQISQTSFSFKSVNQQSSNHRPLVRQAAVDCNNATEALCKNSSVDEACMSSPSSHGEAEDTCGDTSNRKSRRKKAQKFAYNKWYMYGGGTFKKLYDMEKGSENRAHKGAKSFPNSEVYHGLQKRLSAGHCETTTVSSPPLVRSATVHNLETAQFQLMPSASLNGQMSHILASPSSPRMPLRRNLSLSVLPLSFLSLTPNLNFGSNKTNEATKSVSPCPVFQSQVNVPSDRKKQRTDEIDLTLSQPHKTNMQPNSTQVSLFQTSTINTNPQPVASSPTTSVTTPVQKSFMPKYQLKLPNSQEPCSSTNSLSRFTPKEPTSISALPLTTTASYKSDSKQLSTYSSSNSSFSLNHSKPCNPTHINVISTAVHQCLVAETKTTTSLRNSHNSGQLSPKIRSPAHRSVVPTSVKNSSVSFTPIHRTQSSPAAFTTLSSSLGTGTSQGCSPSPLQPQMAIHSDTTEIPPQLVQGQQTIPKVFHVQTPDLQICFQILSDEQLALIEPQIEKQTSSRPLSSEQEPVTAERLKISSTADNTDKTTSHKHCMLNKELDTNNKDSAELSVCNKYESETVHTSKSIGQSTSLPTHPHICVQENKVRKLETSKEGEMLTPPKDTMLEKNIIPQRNLLCNVAAQDEYVPEVQKTEDELVAQASNGPNPSLATVTCTASPHPENNEGIKCIVKHTDICNDDLRYKKSNRKVNRNNLQASMVGLSLSQTNPTSEQTESSLEPEDEHVSSVSTGGTESTAVSQVPDFSAGSKEVSPVGRVEQPSHTGAPEHSEQSHVPLFTDRGGFTNIQLDTQQVEQARSRVDSFPNGWLAGQNCLHNFSQAQLGICEGPPQSSGTNSNLESNSIPAASNNFCNLPPTSQVKSDSMRTASVLSEGNPTEGPRCKTVSSTEVGCQESGLFQQQDQRLHCNDGNSLINYITYTSQSHDHKDSYQFNSSVYVTTPSQTNVLFSDHIRQDKLSLPCDRLLFGMGTPFSYPPGEPPSGAVRVVQSVVEAEDSSDDEGKLIIEL